MSRAQEWRLVAGSFHRIAYHVEKGNLPRTSRRASWHVSPSASHSPTPRRGWFLSAYTFGATPIILLISQRRSDGTKSTSPPLAAGSPTQKSLAGTSKPNPTGLLKTLPTTSLEYLLDSSHRFLGSTLRKGQPDRSAFNYSAIIGKSVRGQQSSLPCPF